MVLLTVWFKNILNIKYVRTEFTSTILNHPISVETKNIDGETNLKIRTAVHSFHSDLSRVANRVKYSIMARYFPFILLSNGTIFSKGETSVLDAATMMSGSCINN